MAKKARKARKPAKRSTARKTRKPARKARKSAKRKPAHPASTKRGRAKSGPASTKRGSAKSGKSKPKKAAPKVERRAPSLERERRRLLDLEETVPTPPSSLNLDSRGSAARSGRAALEHARHEHTETSPALTGGDVDADWEDAYAVGDETPGGDNPTPDQDRVDDIGRALGIQYADNEELKPAEKVGKRDKHRWELDPASAEDYPDHED